MKQRCLFVKCYFSLAAQIKLDVSNDLRQLYFFQLSLAPLLALTQFQRVDYT